MSSSLLLQQGTACLVHLIWMVLEMGIKYPYSSSFVGCCFYDLFRIAHSILAQLPSSFFSIRLVGLHVVHPYGRIDTTTAWKNLPFCLSDRTEFQMIDNLSIAVTSFILMSFSVNDILLPRYKNLSTNFREPPFRVEMSPFLWKLMYSVCLHSHGGCLLQIIQQGFGLGRYICQKRYVIYVVCRVLSASYDSQTIYIYIYIVIHRQIVSLYHNSSGWLDT